MRLSLLTMAEWWLNSTAEVMTGALFGNLMTTHEEGVTGERDAEVRKAEARLF